MIQKKITIALCFFPLTLTLYSQTKRETTDWTLYYLNKFCSFNYSPSEEEISIKMIGWYTYYHNTFSVKNDLLVIEQTQNIKRKDTSASSRIYLELKLSKIQKIYFKTDSTSFGVKNALNFDFYSSRNVADYNVLKFDAKRKNLFENVYYNS
jgi:hypothetical protein